MHHLLKLTQLLGATLFSLSSQRGSKGRQPSTIELLRATWYALSLREPKALERFN